MQNFLINLVIGIIVFVGFFIYWGRASGWYKEGGIVYEWWNQRKTNKAKQKNLRRKPSNTDDEDDD